MAKRKQTETYFSESETAIIAAAVALIRTLNIAESELTTDDVSDAIGHVEGWLDDMDQEYDDNDTCTGSPLFGQVCRECGVEQ